MVLSLSVEVHSFKFTFHIFLGQDHFQQIRQHVKTLDGQSITRQMIAEKAGVTYRDVYLLDIGGHLAGRKMKKVVWAFNQLSGSTLNVHDIKNG
jgi:hypothetical protein